MKYLTYDESGNLTGAYIQDLRDEHKASYIEVGDADYTRWPSFRMNAERTGLEPIPPAPPAPPAAPSSVTMRQARLALLGAGLLDAVAAAIAALPSPQKEAAQIEWEYSQVVERNRPFVLTLGYALGLTDAQLDALFIAAAAL